MPMMMRRTMEELHQRLQPLATNVQSKSLPQLTSTKRMSLLQRRKRRQSARVAIRQDTTSAAVPWEILIVHRFHKNPMGIGRQLVIRCAHHLASNFLTRNFLRHLHRHLSRRRRKQKQDFLEAL